jgi:hypothetical protein
MPQGKAAHHKKLIICKEKPMPELSHIDPRSAALVDLSDPTEFCRSVSL